MKLYLKYILLLCCFTATTTFAQQQDITGVWKGDLLLTDSAGELIHLPYEIAVSEDKGKLVGFSRIVFHANGKDEAGVQDVTLKWKGNDIIMEDEGFIQHQFSINPSRRVKKTAVVQLIITETEMILEGSWSTNKTRYYIPMKGTLVLKRKNDFKKTEIFKSLDTLNLSAKLSFKDRPSTEDPVLIASTTPKPEKKEPPREEPPAPKPEPVITKTEPPAIAVVESEPDLIIPSIEKTTATIQPLNTKPWPARTRIQPLSKPKKTQMDLLAKSTIKPPPPKPAPVIVAAAPKTKPVVEEPEEKEPAVTKSAPVKKPEPVVTKTEPQKPTIAYVAPSANVGAAEINKRVTKSDQSYYFESDSLVLTLYDNGEVDGDTVTVLMNGGVIFSKAGLSTRPNTKTVYITAAMDSVNLVMYAESLGEIPPNTGLLIVNDGEKRYDVRFSADLKTNAAIILRRKKNE
jgi:hypothetical protein